jgi:hypothetical protein
MAGPAVHSPNGSLRCFDPVSPHEIRHYHGPGNIMAPATIAAATMMARSEIIFPPLVDG